MVDKCPPDWVGGNGYFTPGTHRTVHGGLEDLLPIVRDVPNEIADSIDIKPYTREEFSQDIYGGTVTSIELLNEPRLEDDDFPMSQLKDFYIDGSDVVSRVSSGVIGVTIHGKFTC